MGVRGIVEFLAAAEVKWVQDVMARSCSPPSTWACFIEIGLAILCNTLQCSEVDAGKANDLVRYKLLRLQDSDCRLAKPMRDVAAEGCCGMLCMWACTSLV